MSKVESLMRMLEAAVAIQRETSLILEGKAVEAEKVRKWVLAQEPSTSGLKDSLQIHEQIVEQIEGLTRIGSGLCRNLRVALGTEDQAASGGFEEFDFGDSD
ncbi:hypothetical protein V4V36_16515 [Paenibacillus lautus]|uniref:Restriction endonuclease subunit S n=1 Tax=Paenibacillus lautus TaxID=1401 RepID=A0A385TQ12_PAELA|nr:hypothetical protein [Paenibacillus lautus]AYB45879.1 hypothetical protein D5F53_22445 [Paenibacillus lautus]MBY0162938.1 hypothetical protein [Cytobacillus firmus]MCI1775910.1 hypothetical protein [Paenibacillus lautus]VTR22431.1 Uncharacterised protein [Actinobacillus pleuropneumoniae]